MVIGLTKWGKYQCYSLTEIFLARGEKDLNSVSIDLINLFKINLLRRKKQSSSLLRGDLVNSGRCQNDALNYFWVSAGHSGQNFLRPADAAAIKTLLSKINPCLSIVQKWADDKN